MTAKAQARCRRINSHGFFEPRNRLWTHADGNCKSAPLAAAALGLVVMSITVGGGTRVLFKLNGNCESRRSITDSEGTGGLIQFRGTLRSRCARRLNLLTHGRSTDDIQRFLTPDDARGHLRLAITERRIERKGNPQWHTRGVRFAGRYEQAAARDVDRFH